MEICNIEKLNALFELSRLKLGKIFAYVIGAKDLTIEPKLIRPLERICGANWLRSNDIDKIYKLQESDPIHSRATHMYFISCNYKIFQRVLDQIQAKLNLDNTLKYHVIIIPKVLHRFEVLLEENGLYNLVKLHSYCWQFLQIDSGILSLELPNVFSEIFIKKDWSFLPVFSQSLTHLFCLTGYPKITITIGKHSENILKQVDLFSASLPQKNKSDFDAFILVDRSVDYVSTLLTSATYTSLLSEVFNITCGIVNSKVDAAQQLFTLDSVNDSVYVTIKNKHISDVSDTLGNQARLLKSEGEASKDMVLSEIKAYVETKLRDVKTQSKLLSYHLQACEKIIQELGMKFEQLKMTELSLIENTNKTKNIEKIENVILDENDCMSLRLICLMSLTQKLSYDEYHSLRLQYLQQFGYQYLYIFDNLIESNLIQEPTQSKLSALKLLPNINKTNFYTIANKLKLIPAKPESNIRTPTCPSYVFGGCYIPILAHLVTLLTQAQDETDFRAKLELLAGTLRVRNAEKCFPLQRKQILVCIVGGLTYAEVAACNLVEKLCNCKIILCSDSMISGNDLMEASKL